MENSINQNEEFIKQLKETNENLKSVKNLLIGILITTGIVALSIIIAVTKINSALGGYK